MPMWSLSLLLLTAVPLNVGLLSARAQVSTASIVPVGMNEHGIQGEVVGTGAEGTTFVLSATLDALDIPYTMTLVQAATHISKAGLIITSTLTLPYAVQCALQPNGEAVCTEEFNSVTDTTTQDVILEAATVSPGILTGATTTTTFSNTGATTPIATKTHLSVTPKASGPDLPTSTSTSTPIPTSAEGGGDGGGGGGFPPFGGGGSGLVPPGSGARRTRIEYGHGLGLGVSLVLSFSALSLFSLW